MLKVTYDSFGVGVVIIFMRLEAHINLNSLPEKFEGMVLSRVGKTCKPLTLCGLTLSDIFRY